MRPKHLVLSEINGTEINDYVIKKIEVDLKHINYGLNEKRRYRKKQRAQFTIKEVAHFFESLDGLQLEYDFYEGFEYFMIEKKFFSHNKKYRMVFCIARSRPTLSGVITFFQV